MSAATAGSVCPGEIKTPRQPCRPKNTPKADHASVDAASGARCDWRRDPDGDDGDVADLA